MDVIGFIFIAGLIFLFWYFGFRKRPSVNKSNNIADWDMESDIKTLRQRMVKVHGKITTSFKAMDLLAKITMMRDVAIMRDDE